MTLRALRMARRKLTGLKLTGLKLRELIADRRGNVLAMGAAALIPLMAMMGGAIDLSRLYMTNTRLQQACDAGALAARRTMADVNTLSDSEKAIAVNYFNFNFPQDTYGAGRPGPVYARGTVGTVVGNVSLAVPMSVMKIFGYRTVTLNISCQSTLVVPNTDVMFVLDVTGSMNDIPTGDTQSKIAGLKQAVKDFYSALGPGTVSGPGRVRYGFMPYSSNVNVGKIVYNLNHGYIVGGNGPENADYQSRTWTVSSKKVVTWTYQKASFDVSQIVQTGSGPNPAYYRGTWSGTDPNTNVEDYGTNWYGGTYVSRTSATASTVTWGGCIEEARTVPTITASSSLTPPSDAADLNIDLVPSSTETRWKPFLPQLQYNRSDALWMGRNWEWIDNGFAAYPREASALTQYASDYVTSTKSSTSFNDYVDSLSAVGGTYHDIGLIWGARFLSQDGIFASTNSDASAPGGFQVSRHIVFMTDGTLDTRAGANDPWGVNTMDGRIAVTSASDATVTASHSRRVDIICNAMKGKGFTVWVVGFGISTLPTQLTACASDAEHASVASNSAQLRGRFQQIAQTIGGLRLSQ